MVNYIPIENKSAINKLKRKLPYEYDLNIFRGCEHGCKYCYAIYSHDYLNDGNFFNNVYYKKNILTTLEKELSSKSWKNKVINLGSVTDSYQPIEKDLKLTREILKLMIKYKNPIIISTKSDLILRDIDLIDKLSKITQVNIAFTITTIDENLRKNLEPGASSSLRRFEALKKLKATNATLGVHVMPIIPYLTDSYQNIEEIYRQAYLAKVDYVLPGTLYLIGKTKPYFMNFVINYNINIYNKIKDLYINRSCNKLYKDNLYKNINIIKGKYNISSNYMKAIKSEISLQTSFF